MTDLRNDDRVKAFLGLGELLTVDQYSASIKAPRDRCHFAVIRKETDAFIGVTGFLLRECFVDPEIYVWLTADNWGHGLGPEAANGLINTAFRERYCDAVIGVPNRKNTRSIRSLAKMDMKQSASVVDLVEDEASVYGFGREHQFPIFERRKSV